MAAQQQVAAQTAAAAQAAQPRPSGHRRPQHRRRRRRRPPAPTGGVTDATNTSTADWACIRQHESNGNYAKGNGGAYQFQFGTWNALTGLPSPAEDYPPAVQDAAALKLYAQRGWQPWSTRYVCGL